MREQIAELIVNYEGTVLDGADEILTLICEEIEKELLTDEEQFEIYAGAGQHSEYPKVIAQAQLDKILALLRSEKDAV